MNQQTRKIAYAGVFLALALVLPFLTGQIQYIGNMLLPMHLPVLVCGFVLGPVYGLAVGFIAPILRSMIFGMPMMMPMAIGMAFELATYGLVCGLLSGKLGAGMFGTLKVLLVAMLAGRIVWACVSYFLYASLGNVFTWEIFAASGFTTAIPGIILQIVAVPYLVKILDEKVLKNKVAV